MDSTMDFSDEFSEHHVLDELTITWYHGSAIRQSFLFKIDDLCSAAVAEVYWNSSIFGFSLRQAELPPGEGTIFFSCFWIHQIWAIARI